MSSSRWVVSTPVGAGVSHQGEPDKPIGDALSGIWWLGAHGGAGTTTLRTAAGTGQDCGQDWPAAPAGAVLLVARTHFAGLRAARQRLREHGPAAFRGLVLVPDAPGRLPRVLRQQVQVLSGAAPRLWEVPWVEAWRTDTSVSPDRQITRLLSRITETP